MPVLDASPVSHASSRLAGLSLSQFGGPTDRYVTPARLNVSRTIATRPSDICYTSFPKVPPGLPRLPNSLGGGRARGSPLPGFAAAQLPPAARLPCSQPALPGLAWPPRCSSPSIQANPLILLTPAISCLPAAVGLHLAGQRAVPHPARRRRARGQAAACQPALDGERLDLPPQAGRPVQAAPAAGSRWLAGSAASTRMLGCMAVGLCGARCCAAARRCDSMCLRSTSPSPACSREEVDALPSPRIFKSHMPHRLALAGGPARSPCRFIYVRAGARRHALLWSTACAARAAGAAPPGRAARLAWSAMHRPRPFWPSPTLCIPNPGLPHPQIARNPKDVCVSYYHFESNSSWSGGYNGGWRCCHRQRRRQRHRPGRRQLQVLPAVPAAQGCASWTAPPPSAVASCWLQRPCWIGAQACFPTLAAASASPARLHAAAAGPWDHWLQLFLDGRVQRGDWFDHVLSWWEQRQAGNLLFLKYEELKRDFRGQVRR